MEVLVVIVVKIPRTMVVRHAMYGQNAFNIVVSDSTWYV